MQKSISKSVTTVPGIPRPGLRVTRSSPALVLAACLVTLGGPLAASPLTGTPVAGSAPTGGISSPPSIFDTPGFHEMALNADGTFTAPSTGSNTLQITEGDTVFFTGLERTDGIVQSRSLAQLLSERLYPLSTSYESLGTSLPVLGGLPAVTDGLCANLPLAYDAPANIPDENEFTGPLRKGVSGIFALGPMSKPSQTNSYREYDLGAIAPAPNYNACALGEPVAEAFDAGNGHYYQLCRDNPVSNETMPATFENPDIDGVIIRMNWKDIETGHDLAGNGIFDYTRLDAQMAMAVKNGKVFTLDLRSGIYGMPAHEYVDAGGLVTPLQFKTVLTANVEYPACGTVKTLPSPSEQAYRDAYEDFLANVIAHVRSNTAWWQALAHVKLSGVNLNTGEGKTAHLCDAECYQMYPDSCATKVWAEAENLSAGLGWSPERLYQYYREVGNTIYEETLQQKSIGFQLIQSGFPQAVQPDNFFVEGDGLLDNDGNTDDDDLLPLFDEQTEAVLALGRDGDFADRSAPTSDPVAGKAFVVQHSGLQTNPDDTYQGNSGEHTCNYNQSIINDPGGPHDRMAIFPLTDEMLLPLDGPSSGCPNKWARREGYGGQISGWQTNNAQGVANPDEVSSALFNATTNSDGVFVELYEERLWEIMRLRGTGPSALAVTDDPNATYFAYGKNMHQWSEEMHVRRKRLADNDSSNNPYLNDPFPSIHAHTFARDLAPGETQSYWFISPYKCENGGSDSLDRIGRIEVTGT